MFHTLLFICHIFLFIFHIFLFIFHIFLFIFHTLLFIYALLFIYNAPPDSMSLVEEAGLIATVCYWRFTLKCYDYK